MKVKNKVRRLSVQLISMTAILFVIGTVIGAIVLYKGSRDMYLEAKDDMISYDLKELGSSVEKNVHLQWLLDYISKHDDYTAETTEEEEMQISDEFPEYYSEESDDQQFMQKVSQLDPKCQSTIAKREFRMLGNYINSMFENSDYEKLYCIDISPENCGFVYCDAAAAPADYDDALYTLVSSGMKWDYTAKDHPAIEKLRKGSGDIQFEIASIGSEKDATSYIGYLPLCDGKAALCISYDWAPFHTKLMHKVIILVAVLLGAMLLTCVLITVFLRRVVIKPLDIVQSSVRAYMDEKDSKKVGEKLKAVRTSNEISVLSEDVGELTSEMDRYIGNIKELTVEVMEALAKTIDAKDKYTNGHSLRVAIYSRMIAIRLGLSKEDQEKIYYMGLMHDIGKIAIPLEIINKPTRLTDEEYELIKTHPIKGDEILSEIKSMPELITGARWHHERYDGKGYPDGIAGEQIPFLARIIAVADSYDTMTSNRSYRKYLPQDVVRSEIEKNLGTQFDPQAAKAMLEIIDKDTKYMLHE